MLGKCLATHAHAVAPSFSRLTALDETLDEELGSDQLQYSTGRVAGAHPTGAAAMGSSSGERIYRLGEKCPPLVQDVFEAKGYREFDEDDP
jgi:hypothetical protein